MGTLGWTIYRPEGLVIVRGAGVFNLSFITSFRKTVRAEGPVGYCKLFDLSRADIQLSSDDLRAMVASIRFTSATTAGPIAIVVGRTPPPLLVEMAILLKHRIGDRRRLRIFTDEPDAREWLSFEGPTMGLSNELFRLPFETAVSDSLGC
ncbi:MAG: hypothetical protein EPO10_08025 [Reyranella sp.]|uniref:hypothetical protein n=1 Tax=Reyranella sp. TaxID=1929291 RepID=UPI0012190454|nr:hypothetical protein [Reyranella sp.]TAJ87272.1 MAG: hypothetical protein EPO41_23310 [Reyranella sp.]TBR29418.1 MAG: hypothetical protein EPO10_08025 [Reyranella sp.]